MKEVYRMGKNYFLQKWRALSLIASTLLCLLFLMAPQKPRIKSDFSGLFNWCSRQ